MFVACQSPETAIRDWFDWHFRVLKMGLIIAITGNLQYRFGVGKSYTALRLGEILDKNFSIDKVVFEPNDFKRAMELIEEIGKPSQVVVLDEAGILINSKKWYSFINRGIASAMMTFRALRGLAIIVTPALRFIDSDIRIMLSHLIECEKVVLTGYETGVRIKLYKLGWSETTDKFYRYYLTLYVQSLKKIVKFKSFWVNLPSQALIEQYEERVSKYKKKVREQAVEIGSYVERSIEDYVLEVLSNPNLIHETPKGKKVYWSEVKETLHVSSALAQVITRRVNEELMKNG